MARGTHIYIKSDEEKYIIREGIKWHKESWRLHVQRRVETSFTVNMRYPEIKGKILNMAYSSDIEMVDLCHTYLRSIEDGTFKIQDLAVSL